MTPAPLDLLRLAYASNPHFFAITAKAGLRGATVFRWRDYQSGESGKLGTAAPGEAIALADALLAELQMLRQTAAKKPPQTETQEPLLRKASA